MNVATARGAICVAGGRTFSSVWFSVSKITVKPGGLEITESPAHFWAVKREMEEKKKLVKVLLRCLWTIEMSLIATSLKHKTSLSWAGDPNTEKKREQMRGKTWGSGKRATNTPKTKWTPLPQNLQASRTWHFVPWDLYLQWPYQSCGELRKEVSLIIRSKSFDGRGTRNTWTQTAQKTLTLILGEARSKRNLKRKFNLGFCMWSCTCIDLLQCLLCCCYCHRKSHSSPVQGEEEESREKPRGQGKVIEDRSEQEEQGGQDE